MGEVHIPRGAAQNGTGIYTLAFTAYGTPQPAGSKRAFVKGNHARVVDDNPKGKPWKNAVGWEAVAAMAGRTMLDVPLTVAFRFYVARPKGHFGKRGLLPSAPAHPAVRPDVLKLARAVEDALTGIVWRDDAQIVRETLTKEYGEPERVEVEVVPA